MKRDLFEARCKHIGDGIAKTFESLWTLFVYHIHVGNTAKAEPFWLQFFRPLKPSLAPRNGRPVWQLPPAVLARVEGLPEDTVVDFLTDLIRLEFCIKGAHCAVKDYGSAQMCGAFLTDAGEAACRLKARVARW